jgi:BirA family biotin operon repressor/biotin-[acetyl-CoA-carboxylase] ligase
MSVLKDSINIIEFEEIGSTNEKAMELAKTGAPEWTVVFARKQIKGRGRYQRVWESPADLGLWFSVILRPQINLNQLNLINLVTALSIRDFILGIIAEQLKIGRQPKVQLKWPNDVLIENKKVCGILLESRIREDKILQLIVGIGLNLNQEKEDFSDDIRNTATSLKLLTGSSFNLNITLRNFLSYFYDILNNSIGNGFLNVVESYQKNMLYLNERIHLDLGESFVEGIIRGLNELGFLLIDENDERKVISAGDIWRIETKNKI